MKKAIILHNKIDIDSNADESDVLHQVDLVGKALSELGYSWQPMDVGFDIYSDLQKVTAQKPNFVFNLTEAVFEKSALQYIVPSILAANRIPYTGVSAFALHLTTNKIQTKQFLTQNNIPTAEWFLLDNVKNINPKKRYILKPIWEEGSVGLDEDSVFFGDNISFINNLKNYNPSEYFIEEYLNGREFNAAILPKKNDIEVLPVAEMIFQDFPEGKPKILGYKAKWNEESFEYHHTNRSFETLKHEPKLRESINQICEQCYKVFDLNGYSRVDIRANEQNMPYVLEINGNPCISPDSGFIAAAHNVGYTNTQIIERIISNLNY